MHSAQSAFARATLNIFFLAFAAATMTQACLASDSPKKAQRATDNLRTTGSKILQKSDKDAHYNTLITVPAATVGILTEQLAQRKFETSEKKAFFVGIAATSVASLGGHYLQKGEHTAETIFTQVAIDAAVYTAVHHVNNYFWPVKNKKKTAQKAANPETTVTPTTPALSAPKASRADLTVPSLLKVRG